MFSKPLLKSNTGTYTTLFSVSIWFFKLEYFLVSKRLNGPDPLDYVNIYINNDEKNNGLNSHFHYVSLGLTDLYGDERVHK